MNVTVERCGTEAAERLAELDESCFSVPWSREDFAAQTADGDCLALLARDESGRTPGYILLHLAEDEAEVYRLCVEPGARRLGIGNKLLRQALKLAAERGVRRFYLEVRQSNLPARTLYGGFGFHEVGTRKRYYRDPEEDAVILVREEEQA